MGMSKERAAEICLKVIILEGDNEFSIEKSLLDELISDAEKAFNFLLNLVKENNDEDCPPVEELVDLIENNPEINENATILNITPEEYKQYLFFMYLGI